MLPGVLMRTADTSDGLSKDSCMHRFSGVLAVGASSRTQATIVPQLSRAWTHSDINGTCFVIRLDAQAARPAAGPDRLTHDDGPKSVLHAQIVGRIRVGALPVHGYNIPQLSQFWAHSDIDGAFFVINVNNVNATTAKVAVRSISPLRC